MVSTRGSTSNRGSVRRRLSAVLAATALATALAVGSLGQVPPAHAATTRTAVHVFKPWRPDGRLLGRLRIVGRFRGSCWTESIAVPGEYRCLAGNEIFDPCFSKPRSHGKVVGCLLAPWDRGVRTIRLTKKLPKVARPRHLTGTRFPWAIELRGGMLCLLGQGTNPVIEHKVMVYSCKNGAAGEINRSKEPWRTEYSRSLRHGRLVRRSVAQAWY